MNETMLKFAQLIKAISNADLSEEVWQDIANDTKMSMSAIEDLIYEAKELVDEAKVPEEF